MKYYGLSCEEAMSQLESGESGLTERQAAERLEKFGANKLAEGKKVGIVSRFLSQLADPMIIVLIAAAVISGVTSFYSGESFADVFIIMFVVVLNAVLGVVQESKAEKAIDALKQMSAATSKVMRDGKVITVRSEQLVRGDVVVLEAGDAVPADLRIIESHSLKSEEAALTGESVPVNKHSDRIEGECALGDRRNMAYMGSTVVYGRGRGIVTATGMDTEMGKIADAIEKAENSQTPLQIKLAQLSRILTVLVIGICLFIFAFGVLRTGDFSGENIISAFMIAVSLAVAAIPEGLAAVVTIVLSMGVTKMSKRSAIIRKLTAVETLGCTQIICSDKTGTLTQNKMTVTEAYADDSALLAKAMALCSDAELSDDGQATGEPTECALVNYANAEGFAKDDLKSEYPRIGEAPFDSSRKMMSTVHKHGDGYIQFTKGAPDEVLKCCTSMLKDGREQPLDEQARELIIEQNRKMADKALRVLCAAYRKYDAQPDSYEPNRLERELVFVGLTGMIDPIRPEVKTAVEQCRDAGIRPIMITGDHRDTAVAIGRELGIITGEGQAITGAELDSISDEQLASDVERYSVYARVQPEHKSRIVNAWRKKGMVTAMTGDGVNDAPSIKNADIGIGMGITGTDVTKNVADMVLADDNFATIVSAVEEGRRIYDNIRKSIQFLLSSNLSEVLSIFAATVMGFTILNPVHILWINLITDCFPALALGTEKSEDDIMHRKPRAASDGIFSGGVGADVAYQGILIAVLTLAAYFIGHYMEAGVWEITNSADGMTMAFLTMSMAEIFHSLNMRSQKGSLFKMKHGNVFLLGAMAASFVLTAAVIYVPFLSELFGFTAISLAEYAVAMGLALAIIPTVELVKLCRRAADKKAAAK